MKASRLTQNLYVVLAFMNKFSYKLGDDAGLQFLMQSREWQMCMSLLMCISRQAEAFYARMCTIRLWGDNDTG